MFLKLTGRKCLVVGAGIVGEPKIRSLTDCGADLTVIAPTATTWVADASSAGQFAWIRRTFQSSDLDGMFLVVAATSSRMVNHRIYREAQQRGLLCNVVDDPRHCDFFYPAVVRREHFQIAISTGGLSPALAQRIRKQLEAEFPPIYGQWLKELGHQRAALFDQVDDAELRRCRIHLAASREAFAEFEKKFEQHGMGKDLL